MDHAEATSTQAPDRYLLGELSAAEADAFEEHYFDCAECADDLRAGMQLMSGGRSLAREAKASPALAPVIPIAPRRARWIPAVAAAALMLAITTPVIIKQWRSANAPAFEVATEYLVKEGVRGPNDGDVKTFDGNAPIVLWVPIPSEPIYSHYEAHLHRPDGSVLSLPITRDPEGDPTALTVRGLAAGNHELVIIGTDPAGQHAVLIRDRFIVRR